MVTLLIALQICLSKVRTRLAGSLRSEALLFGRVKRVSRERAS